MVPMPAAGEKVLGGHAVLAVGYNDNSQRFIVRNSWGPGWGMGGYFTVPYAYLTDNNLSDDFWTMRLVAKAAARSQRRIEAQKLTGAAVKSVRPGLHSVTLIPAASLAASATRTETVKVRAAAAARTHGRCSRKPIPWCPLHCGAEIPVMRRAPPTRQSWVHFVPSGTRMCWLDVRKFQRNPAVRTSGA